MKTTLLASLLLLALPLSSFAAEPALWYRDAGDYLAQRSVRMGRPTETNSQITTDAKRFDVTLGKRLSLITWDEKSPSNAWTAGIDGGMLASLLRYQNNGQLTFATNTFDGFFGAFIAKGWDGWLVMARLAHLSAHLVDNSPQILSPIGYSQFWEEVTVGKTFPNPEEASDWELHLQGTVGYNHESVPSHANPRAALGASFGHAITSGSSYALLASADLLKAGVLAQKSSYTFFAGLGTLNRPGITKRPYRVGVAHYAGSDYRDQFYNKTQKWTTFQVATEF